MSKNEALEYMKSHPGVYFKLDWWSSDMAIVFDSSRNIFVSGVGVPIRLDFLQDGNYQISSYKPFQELGGLFSL